MVLVSMSRSQGNKELTSYIRQKQNTQREEINVCKHHEKRRNTVVTNFKVHIFWALEVSLSLLEPLNTQSRVLTTCI